VLIAKKRSDWGKIATISGGGRMRTILAGLALTTLLAAQAAADAKSDLMATDRAFSALSVAKGSNTAFLAYLADDGRLLGTGNQPPIFGKAAALKRFSDPRNGNGDPKANVLSWVPDNAEASQDGTLGYTDGHWLFEGAPDAKGKRVRLTGHYVTVWRKAGASWKVAADMGTTDPKPNH
jgi:ketosteroid isomerase-like protein